jgi:hypothetical protein
LVFIDGGDGQGIESQVDGCCFIFLSGTDGLETVDELQAKEHELEQKLYREHERLMEKELILEEVTELSERLRKQATNGRDYTLELAKKVNNWQHSIKQKTKKVPRLKRHWTDAYRKDVNVELPYLIDFFLWSNHFRAKNSVAKFPYNYNQQGTKINSQGIRFLFL